MTTKFAWTSKALAVLLLAVAFGMFALGSALAAPGKSGNPQFKVDENWPKPLPHNWELGQVGGIAVDQNDNVWIVQRPRSLTSDEAGATDAFTMVCDDGFEADASGACADGSTPTQADAYGNLRPFGPLADCCIPAPPVMQFDSDGNLLQAWGGPVQRDPAWNWPEPNCLPSQGCDWPAGEHGIYVDNFNNVYVGGNGTGTGTLSSGNVDHGADSQVLKFAADGTFLLQVGDPGATAPNSNDTNGAPNGTPQLYRPADMEVDPETNRLYIADGYGNHRVVVVDANSGAYVGHFGAYGQNPVDDGAADAVGPYGADRDAGVTPLHFRNPVHCVRITDDDMLYVCDRVNNRIQVFDKTEVGAECDNSGQEEGECGFLTEKFINRDTLGPGAVWDLDTSTDRDQSCLYNADGTNQRVDLLHRASLEILDTFGDHGRYAGEFHWVHNLAVNSRGDIYTAEVDTGKRAQKFVRTASPGCRN